MSAEKVMELLEAKAGKWVRASEIVKVTEPGKFWETMDSLGGRVSKTAMTPPDGGHAAMHFKAIR